MSSKKYKLHFASSIIQTVKEVKAFIFPALIVLAINRFNININSFQSVLELLPVIVIVSLFVYSIIRGITTWLTFTYWIEDEELKTEYGLLFKKKRFIPIERIQNLNYNEGVIHRLFNVVQISIETAGGTTSVADVELSAVTKNAANEMERLIHQSYKRDDQNEQSSQVNEIIFKMKNENLVLLATTSSSVGVVLAGIAALFSQIIEIIPFDKISVHFSLLQHSSLFLLTLLIATALLIAWIISVAMSFLSYYDFTLSYFEGRLEISRGLLEKKKITIPVGKIQAVKIVENPLRQLFGYATVTIENAGSSMTSASEKKVVLLPLIKKSEIQSILQNIMDIDLNVVDGTYSPKRARPLFYRKYVMVLLAFTVIATIYISNYSLALLLLIPPFAYLGFIQHRNACFKLSDQQLVVQYRVISKVLYIVKHNKVQVFEMTQTVFQKHLQIYTGKVYVMGNMGGVKIKIYNQTKEALNEVYRFIKKRDV